LGLVWAGAACNPLIQVDGGAFSAFSDRPGRTGGVADLRVGAVGDEPAGGGPAVGGSGGLRLKLSEALTQVALCADLMVFPVPGARHLLPFLRLGVNGFQFEDLDDSFGFGLYSPYAELGSLLVVTPSQPDRWFVSFGLGVEYDLRLTDQPNEGYWYAVLGFGVLGTYSPPAQP
jgi:hypothetical protein